MSEPLSEERIHEIEFSLGEVFANYEALALPAAGPFIRGQLAEYLRDSRAGAAALIAEVRRLRALFPDPEADATLCEVVDYSPMEADLANLAARIRQVTTGAGE